MINEPKAIPLIICIIATDVKGNQSGLPRLPNPVTQSASNNQGTNDCH